MKNEYNKEWKLISNYSLKDYECGLKSGDKLKIIKAIDVLDCEGNKTGQVYKKGEIWSVLSGVKDEPDVIWLKQADGERHTWDEDSIFEYFEITKL